MQYLFFSGFAGVLFGLSVGVITGNYLLGIFLVLAGIGAILFAMPFLVLPVPVDVNIQLDINDQSGKNIDFKKKEKEDEDDKPDWGNVPGDPI